MLEERGKGAVLRRTGGECSFAGELFIVQYVTDAVIHLAALSLSLFFSVCVCALSALLP